MYDTFRNSPCPTTVVVHFAERVRGPAPIWPEASDRMNDWHTFDADEMVHDDGETLFLLGHELVGVWTSELITRVEWYPSENDRYGEHYALRAEQRYQEQLAQQRERREERRRQHPRLGQPWTEEEEDRLRREHADGLTLVEMAARHERTRNGITTRLDKMGLPWPPSEPMPSGVDDEQGWLHGHDDPGAPAGDEPPEPEEPSRHAEDPPPPLTETDLGSKHGPRAPDTETAEPGSAGAADEAGATGAPNAVGPGGATSATDTTGAANATDAGGATSPAGAANERLGQRRNRLNGAGTVGRGAEPEGGEPEDRGPGDGPGRPEGGSPVAPAPPDTPVAPVTPLAATPPRENATSERGAG